MSAFFSTYIYKLEYGMVNTVVYFWRSRRKRSGSGIWSVTKSCRIPKMGTEFVLEWEMARCIWGNFVHKCVCVCYSDILAYVHLIHPFSFTSSVCMWRCVFEPLRHDARIAMFVHILLRKCTIEWKTELSRIEETSKTESKRPECSTMLCHAVPRYRIYCN